MDKNFLFLKRASASRPSSEWNDDAFDVLAEKFDYRACWSFPVEAPSAQPSDLKFATALTRTAATIITKTLIRAQERSGRAGRLWRV